jgi:hypothetical protein
VAASGLRLGGEQKCIRYGLDTCRHRTPAWTLSKAWVCSILESRDPAVSGPDPTQRGPDPILGVRFAHVEVLDHTRRPGPYIQGSDTFPWESKPTHWRCFSVRFSGHVAAPDLPMWWG